MSDRDLNRAVARATGEPVDREVSRAGDRCAVQCSGVHREFRFAAAPVPADTLALLRHDLQRIALDAQHERRRDHGMRGQGRYDRATGLGLDQQHDLRRDIAELGQNKAWLAMFAMTLFVFVTLSLRGGAYFYYFSYYVDSATLGRFLDDLGLVSSSAQSSTVGVEVDKKLFPADRSRIVRVK